MPDVYAHYCFGRDVLNRLSSREQAIIEKNRRLYDIGLHGPDPLFYYYPLTHHPLHEVGRRMHGLSGTDYFTAAGSTFCSRGEPDADRAFLYGFLCHYALDSTCHGYIDSMSIDEEEMCHGDGSPDTAPEESGTGEPSPGPCVTHSEIEISFDRLMLVMDGRDPIRTDRAESLRMSPVEAARCAAVMKGYFPGVSSLGPDVSAARLRTSLLHMAFIVRSIRLPRPAQRRALELGIRAIGREDTLRGRMVPPEADIRCAETDAELLTLYGRALPLAVSLITSFTERARGQRQWPDRCLLDFGSLPPKRLTHQTVPYATENNKG